MKIFLSSTAYDLSDCRAIVVDRLEKDGHEVLFHESPTFPARIGLHSHDQCLEAIKESDLVICLVDKRYGGKYNGSLLEPFAPLEFSVLGSLKSGNKKRYELKYDLEKLSITWCEVYVAHKEGIPVVTFARQRTLDEKETRRRNQYLSSFSPAYAKKNEIFDFLDWITQREKNNWIAPFISIVDFETKLLTWIGELNKSILAPKPKEDTEKDSNKSRVCIVVEGEVDRLVVSHLVNYLNLTQHFVIIPTYGKYQVLNNFQIIVAPYAKIFEYVIVLLDSDSQTEGEYRENKSQLIQLIEKSGADNISGFFAHPTIESWIVAGLEPDLYKRYQGLINKKIFNEFFGRPSINHIRNLLVHKFSFDKAMSINIEFHNFVEHLMGFGYRKDNG
jgi:hypothetical protein